MKKSISDSRSSENISDRRLRTEVQAAQNNAAERVKRFVNVHLHCIVSSLKMISLTLPFPGKIYVDAHGCTDFDLILGS